MSKRDQTADQGAGKRARCPICRKPAGHAYQPFCSRRCADVDLARWLGDGYAIAGHADAEEDGAAPPADTNEPGRH